MDPLVKDILIQAAVWCLLLGSLAGLVAGAVLLWRPDRLVNLNGVLNRWISTRQLDGVLEKNISIDPWFYRHRYLSASLILPGSFYILYFCMVRLDALAAADSMAKHYGLPVAAAAWMLDAMVLTSLTGAVLAILVGLFLLLRPSSLRDFEQSANRWISLRRAMKPMEIERYDMDAFVFRHGRSAGMALIVGSLYVLTQLMTWISH